MTAAMRLLFCLLISTLLVGCGPAEQKKLGTMTTSVQGMFSKEELRELLNVYRNYYISQMKQTADQLDAMANSRRIERINLQMRMRMIDAVDTLLEPGDPVEAFIEMWGLVLRMRLYLTEGEGRSLYGTHQAVAVRFAEETEAEIERISRQFLNEEKFQLTRENLVRFANQNPIRGTYSNLVILALKIKKDPANPLLSALSVPMAPFRAMEGVDRTPDAILQVRNSADRFTDVVKELPELARWEAVMLLDELNEAPMTQSFLASLQTFADSSARLTVQIENLAQTLNNLEKSQAGLQETLKLTQQTSTDMRATADTFSATAQSIEQTGKTLQQMAADWNQAAVSSRQLVELFKTEKKRSPEDPEPFGMRDFDAMVEKIGQTADTVNRSIADLQDVLDSDAKEQLRLQFTASIDHIAKRILQILLAAFALMLLYHFLTKKRTFSAPNKKKT